MHNRFQQSRPRRRLGLAGYPLVLALLAGALTFLGAGEPLEINAGLRFLYQLRGPAAPPRELLIVAIDDPSIRRLNASATAIEGADPHQPTRAEILGSAFAQEFPTLAACMPERDVEALSRTQNKLDIPRSLHACLLPLLNASAPSAIFFDILFEERGDNPESDRMLAEALAATPNAAILLEVKRNPAIGVEVVRFPTERIRAAVAGEVERMAHFAVDNIGGSTRYIETFGAFPDLRSAPQMMRDLHLGRPVDPPPPVAAGERAFGDFWLYGPPGALPVLTLADLLAYHGDMLPADLSGVAIFVGAWDERIKNVEDSFSTPLADDRVGDHSGVELAATAFLNEIEGRSLRRLGYGARGALVGALAFVLLGLGRMLTGYRGVLAIAAVISAWSAGAAWAFAAHQVWAPFAVPLFVLAPLAAILSVGANYARVRDVVERLAPLPIARLLIAQRDKGPMESREDMATVLFADLTGSTTIAEMIPVDRFRDLMNAFFELGAEAVEGEGGMIDKFMGDGFMALFTESFTGPDHADRAVAAAERLARSLRDFNAGRGGPDAPVLTMRAGINTGAVELGEVGARSRANPTAIGDVVNVAARLEQLGRDLFGAEREVILLSGDTERALRGAPPGLVDCGRQRIRGRKTPVKVVKLILS